MDFKKKYIKYKTKYLELKNHGGSGHLKDEELLKIQTAMKISNQLSDEISDDDSDDDSNDIKKPGLDRQISVSQVKEYKEYLDFINKHEIIFNKTFILDGFELQVLKGNIYISKLYNYNGKKIYLKLSLHDYSDPNRDNHVHIIKFEGTNNEDDKEKYKELKTKSSSGILVKKFGNIFKRNKYDYFPFKFSFNEDNKLLFDLELKSNLKNNNKYFEKWSLNYDLISLFMDEIGDNIGRSFNEIVMYNFYNNDKFYNLIKQKINELNKNYILNEIYVEILNLLNNNNKIKSEDDKKNIFYLWMYFINQNKIDFSSLINSKVKKFNRHVTLKNIELYKNELKSLVNEDYLKTISQKDIIKNLTLNLSAEKYIKRKKKKEIIDSFKEDFKKEIIKIFKLKDESFKLKLNRSKILNSNPIEYARKLKINAIKNILPLEIYETIKNKMKSIGAKKKTIGQYLKLIEENKKINLIEDNNNNLIEDNKNINLIEDNNNNLIEDNNNNNNLIEDNNNNNLIEDNNNNLIEDNNNNIIEDNNNNLIEDNNNNLIEDNKKINLIEDNKKINLIEDNKNLLSLKKKINLFRKEWKKIFPKNFNLQTNEIIKLINQGKNPQIIFKEIDEWRNTVKILTNGTKCPGKAKAYRNMQFSPEDYVKKFVNKK